MADTIETTAVPVEPTQPAPEETFEQKMVRVTAEINDYLMKNGLQLQVEHKVVLSPVKKAE